VPAVEHHASTDALKLTALFVMVTVLNLLEGGPSEAGGGGPAGLAACGPTCFWISEASQLLLILAFVVHVRASLAIAAGLVAGLFGVGGGILKGPSLLALGMLFSSLTSRRAKNCAHPLSLTSSLF